MDGGDSLVSEQILLSSCNLNVVLEVGFHVGEFEGFEMSATDHTGGERLGCVEQELVDEGVLPAQDQRHKALLVEGHLGQAVQLSEDF